MKRGLVLGKFMPLHYGHFGLIEFALSQCEHLTVLLCFYKNEPISGAQRVTWLNEMFADNLCITVMVYEYDLHLLPDSSEPKPEYAKLWAEKIQELIPGVDVFFSSEAYGSNVASRLNIKHILFDESRLLFPVSASLIRQQPLTYWDFIPTVAQPYFVKKVMLLGSESTGKSTLAERLANQYQTKFVPEKAREIIGHTEECTFENLGQIASLHAKTIINQIRSANKLLFCDTDVTVTKSYSNFLFQKKLHVPQWIEDANRGDLYLFLETDCAYIQDGTRLEQEERNSLSDSHKRELEKSGIAYKLISGDWEDRFNKSCKEINHFISNF